MKSKSKFLNNNIEVIIMATVALIVLIPLLYSLGIYAYSKNILDLEPFIEKPDEKYDECVKDAKYMRLNHMDLLKEIRNESMREGKRGTIELNNCRKCHTSRAFCK